MQQQSSRGERRRYPRSNKRIAFTISLNDYDLVAESRNLSCNGVYCSVNRAIPEMTRLRMLLNLNGVYAECEGTVVRIEPDTEQAGTFNMAIFFDDIRPSERQKILDFIEQGNARYADQSAAAF